MSMMKSKVSQFRNDMSSSGLARKTAWSWNLGWDAWTSIALIVGSITIAGAMGSSYWTRVFMITGILVIATVWNNVLMGDAGMISFGQAAVMGAGAYGTAIAITRWDVPFVLALVVGIACGAAVGAIFAIPAQKVESYYLGFVTLAAGLAFEPLVRELSWITGGIRGINVMLPSLKDPMFASLTPLALIIAAFGVFAVVAQVRLRRSPLGRQMLVAKTSPEAAVTLGVNPGRMRAIAFILTGAMTGLAGGLYVTLVGYVGADAFDLDLSFLFFFAVIAGGTGYALGSVLGIGLLYIIPNVLFASLVQYRLLAYGVAIFLIMLLIPDGIVGRLVSIGKFLRGNRVDPKEASKVGREIKSTLVDHDGRR